MGAFLALSMVQATARLARGRTSATVIHTSRSTAPGNNQLVDIFSPPRRDFCDLGYVCNGAEYPVADTEGDKE